MEFPLEQSINPSHPEHSESFFSEQERQIIFIYLNVYADRMNAERIERYGEGLSIIRAKGAINLDNTLEKLATSGVYKDQKENFSLLLLLDHIQQPDIQDRFKEQALSYIRDTEKNSSYQSSKVLALLRLINVHPNKSFVPSEVRQEVLEDMLQSISKLPTIQAENAAGFAYELYKLGYNNEANHICEQYLIDKEGEKTPYQSKVPYAKAYYYLQQPKIDILELITKGTIARELSNVPKIIWQKALEQDFMRGHNLMMQSIIEYANTIDFQRAAMTGVESEKNHWIAKNKSNLLASHAAIYNSSPAGKTLWSHELEELLQSRNDEILESILPSYYQYGSSSHSRELLDSISNINTRARVFQKMAALVDVEPEWSIDVLNNFYEQNNPYIGKIVNALLKSSNPKIDKKQIILQACDYLKSSQTLINGAEWNDFILLIYRDFPKQVVEIVSTKSFEFHLVNEAMFHDFSEYVGAEINNEKNILAIFEAAESTGTNPYELLLHHRSNNKDANKTRGVHSVITTALSAYIHYLNPQKKVRAELFDPKQIQQFIESTVDFSEEEYQIIMKTHEPHVTAFLDPSHITTDPSMQRHQLMRYVTNSYHMTDQYENANELFSQVKMSEVDLLFILKEFTQQNYQFFDKSTLAKVYLPVLSSIREGTTVSELQSETVHYFLRQIHTLDPHEVTELQSILSILKETNILLYYRFAFEFANPHNESSKLFPQDELKQLISPEKLEKLAQQTGSIADAASVKVFRDSTILDGISDVTLRSIMKDFYRSLENVSIPKREQLIKKVSDIIVFNPLQIKVFLSILSNQPSIKLHKTPVPDINDWTVDPAVVYPVLKKALNDNYISYLEEFVDEMYEKHLQFGQYELLKIDSILKKISSPVKKADFLQGLIELVSQGEMKIIPYKNLIQLAEQVSLITPQIIKRYLSATVNERLNLIRRIKTMQEFMIKDFTSINPEIQQDQLYADIIYAIYRPVGMTLEEVKTNYSNLEDKPELAQQYIFPDEGYPLKTRAYDVEPIPEKINIYSTVINNYLKELKKIYKKADLIQGFIPSVEQVSMTGVLDVFLPSLLPYLNEQQKYILTNAFQHKSFDKQPEAASQLAELYNEYLPQAFMQFIFDHKDNSKLQIIAQTQIAYEQSQGKNQIKQKLKTAAGLASANNRKGTLGVLTRLLTNYPEIATSSWGAFFQTASNVSLEEIGLHLTNMLKQEELPVNIPISEDQIYDQWYKKILQEGNGIATTLMNARNMAFRFSQGSEIDYWRLKIGTRKDAFFARASAGICTYDDTEHWNDPKRFHAVIVANDKVVGVVMLEPVEIDISDRKETVLTARAFNISEPVLQHVDATNITAAIIQVLKEFAIKNNMKALYTVPQTNWHPQTNRLEIAEAIEQYREKNSDTENTFPEVVPFILPLSSIGESIDSLIRL